MKVPVNWKQIDKFSQTMFTSDIPTVGRHMKIVELSRSSRSVDAKLYNIILYKEHLIWQSVIYTTSLFGITTNII
jgi:hypothetical protein